MASTLPQPNSCCSLCDGLTVTVDTGGGGGGSGNGVIEADTVALLRAVNSNPLTGSSVAVLLGDTIKFDFGPAKFYVYQPDSVEADNPFSVIVPNDRLGSPNGRWIQIV